MELREKIIERAVRELFGGPLITNVWRSAIVEAMVAEALAPIGWQWCSRDYASYDFLGPKGSRLEVKQVALKQTWGAPKKLVEPRFHIAPRTGMWVGSNWQQFPMPSRPADIYLLCCHPDMDSNADHVNPEQWLFMAVASEKLPSTKSLSLAKAKKLGCFFAYSELPEKLSELECSRSGDGAL